MPKTDAFDSTFATLRKLLKPYEKQFEVVADEPGKYYLASKTAKTRSGTAIWFGGVQIMKSYVSFHLGAVESNTASLRLAARLGFVPVDECVVLSRGHRAFLSGGFTG